MGYNFKFVGDGSVLVANKNPDFLCEDRKLIIELYGDYWHGNPLEYKKEDIVHHDFTAGQLWYYDSVRLDKFKATGYYPLVIWEHEITKKSNRPLLESKLINFYNGCCFAESFNESEVLSYA